MKELIKNNWINALGITFLFTAFLYGLKLAANYGWLPPEVRVSGGLVIGVSFLFLGVNFFKKGKTSSAELVSGLGIAIFYATLAYVSFSETIRWSTNALLIAMVAVSLITSVIAVKSDRRILYLLSTIGGLITPLILRASEGQDLMLFTYLLVLNIAAMYVSTLKKWEELKVISFVSSLAIYATYYILFDPAQWQRPFFYSAAFFLVYMVGITISSWKQEKNELGINQYLSILNAINFVFWSNYIFAAFEIPHTLPMLIVGIFFLSIGALMYLFKEKQFSLCNGSYLGIGLIVMAIACSDTVLILGNGLNYVVNCSIWLVLIGFAFALGKQHKNPAILFGTYIGFFLLSTYWYSVAWNVEWTTILGIKYIPFLNAGALVWIGLALLGFYFSKYELTKTENKHPKHQKTIASALATISHLIVGGLLTVQISNLWEAYEITFLKEQLAMSICWFVYALMIYLWSNYSQHVFFKYFGAIVIGITTLKVFLLDLSGAASIQKVVLLAIIGAITLIIGKVTQKKN